MAVLLLGSAWENEAGTDLVPIGNEVSCEHDWRRAVLNFTVDRTDLYRSRKGQYFIAGESGMLGRWGQHWQGGSSQGRGLRLVSAEEARRLLEEVEGPVEDHFESSKVKRRTS
jgi:hypothetical protein